MNETVEIYNRVRELVKDPQHGSGDYGRLGALPIQYRAMIHELCDYAESMDKMIMTAYNKDLYEARKMFSPTNKELKIMAITIGYYKRLVHSADELDALKQHLIDLGKKDVVR